MKVKLVDRLNIIFDHQTWNDEKTQLSMASELDSGNYFDYIDSSPPNDAPEGLWYTPYYEKINNVIYQKWELVDLSIEQLKAIKIRQIHDYDTSDNVNVFYIDFMMGGNIVQTTPAWLNREERMVLTRRFEIEEKNGIINTVLWYDGNKLPLIVTDALVMLDYLELYAINCYDVTQEHEYNVNAITDKTLVLAYDNTVGYPNRIHMPINL